MKIENVLFVYDIFQQLLLVVTSWDNGYQEGI